MKTLGWFSIPIILLLCSCQAIQDHKTTSEGVWRSVGYGRVLLIDTHSYTEYDMTEISCLPFAEGNISDIDGTLSISNDTLAISDGISMYYYVRSGELPSQCESKEYDANDPVYIFEVYARTYEEHYAYFHLNGINWDSLYSRYRNKIMPGTSEAELYLLLEDFLAQLNDNHGSIEPTDDVYTIVDQLNAPEKETETKKEYGDFEIANMVTDFYLDENLTKDSWLIHWGILENNIGYIQVKAMFLYADIHLPDSLVEEMGYVGAYFEELGSFTEQEQVRLEISGVSNIMDHVMNDLADTEYLILDVRFNGGGKDEVGLEILSRFNNERRAVAAKKARHQQGYTRKTPVFLDAHPSPYTKPVYLLTSQQSASATEIMAMSAMQLNHVTRVGSHTNGALSDALPKQLPNGWHFTLSNEIYTDRKGVLYENIGIPVDIELNYPADRQSFFRQVANNLEQDKQAVLNAIGR